MKEEKNQYIGGLPKIGGLSSLKGVLAKKRKWYF